jgi:hypothetical protein
MFQNFIRHATLTAIWNKSQQNAGIYRSIKFLSYQFLEDLFSTITQTKFPHYLNLALRKVFDFKIFLI